MRLAFLTTGLLVALTIGCGGGGQGGAGQPCHGGGTCNSPFTCLNNVCVNATGSGGQSGVAAAAGVGGTAGAAGSSAAGSGAVGGAREGVAGAAGESADDGGAAGAAGGGGSAGGAAGTAGEAGTGGAAGVGGIAGTGGAGAAGGQAGAACSDERSLPSHFDCGNNHGSTCGQCLVALGSGDTVCNCLTGSAKTDCQALLTCMSAFFFSCAIDDYETAEAGDAWPSACYCSDSTCSNGADGPCAAQFQTVAGTSDPMAVIEQMNDSSTTVAKISQEATHLGLTAGCGMYCGCL